MSNEYDEYGSLSGNPMNTSVILYLLIQLLCLIIPLSAPSQHHAEPPPPPALYQSDGTTLTYDGKTYRIITVSGGDLSGHRDPQVAVNVGYGTREYWALTNEHAQLIHVLAPRIILQDPTTEPLTSRGRYYSDEARVQGTERPDLDKGHIIADSLGGVANAYNITPPKLPPQPPRTPSPHGKTHPQIKRLHQLHRHHHLPHPNNPNPPQLPLRVHPEW